MIPEDTIIKQLNVLLSSSDPGDTLHHLHVVGAPMDAVGPLGLADESKLHTTVYAIAADKDAEDSPADFIRKVIAMAHIEEFTNDRVTLFAALSAEVWIAPPDELSRRLRKEGRLQEHPEVTEATRVYGACRDGRRWRGQRTLTGPNAGKTQNIDLLVGRPHRGESYGVPGEQLLLQLVGIR